MAMRKLVFARYAAVLTFLFLPAVALGLEVNDYSPARNDRFSSGYPASPVANTSSEFIGSGYDWSGVGWRSGDGSRSYALLDSRHFLYAAHYSPGSGATIQFASTDGPVKSYVVGDLSGSLQGDLAIGTFTAPIPKQDNVHPYPILFQGYLADTYFIPPSPTTSSCMVRRRGLAGTRSTASASSAATRRLTTISSLTRRRRTAHDL